MFMQVAGGHPHVVAKTGKFNLDFFEHAGYFPCRRFMGLFLTQSPVLTKVPLRISPKPSCPGSPTPLSLVLRPGRDTSSQTWRSRSKSPQTYTELFSGLRYIQVPMCYYSVFVVNLLTSILSTSPQKQAMVLCHFLETNQDKYSLADKNVIELGAGTGLVTIVSSLLGLKRSVCDSVVLCCFETLTCATVLQAPR